MPSLFRDGETTPLTTNYQFLLHSRLRHPICNQNPNNLYSRSYHALTLSLTYGTPDGSPIDDDSCVATLGPGSWVGFGSGGASSALNKIQEHGEEGGCLSAFQALADVLLSLTNNDSDGRLIISRSSSSSSFRKQGRYIKFVMLSGEKIFSEIVDQAHAVLLVGELSLDCRPSTRERLFPWLPPNQLHFFSCSHIVPPDSILPIAVSRSPSGRSFDFSYSSRSSTDMMRELGLLQCNSVTVVPEGIVVFFPSFDYEGKVYETWESSGILERITRRKHIFREPRNNMDVESVLKEYKDTICALSSLSREANQASHSGAVLLAVVGGKISEGINLSDGMGRCVVMVGLPYASPSDIELLERIKHIEGF
ncbi:hypothetical protein PIB30_087875 [Stylosanthes scabra]|uniref:ATP-dependent helicase C-terminal domain-containing protein n=1 Tax=Stylosanthes scabra TaxID=79078 RepID=A0ABU6RTF1_9FABA|nr:hypothetical protein [Stylosanthes scabra]